MLPTMSAFTQNEQNKENFASVSAKCIDNDDHESSDSDCLIVEPDVSTSTVDDSNLPPASPGVLPSTLPKQTDLLLIYENRVMDVHLVGSVVNLEQQQHITIAHLDYFYSIPKRHLYLSTPCDIEHTSVPRQCRIMHTSVSKTKFTLGFIGETPSYDNHLRHLLLFDEGTAAYTTSDDHVHLCLCQHFERNARSIESKSVRKNFEEIFLGADATEKPLRTYTYVRVKKFGEEYHNAQIIDLDCSIVKLKFYERQAQTEIWMHRQSLLIDDVLLSPVELASPVILPNKRKYEDTSSPFSVSSTRSLRSNLYRTHQCSPHCVLAVEENFNPNCISQNPYTLPFSYGWKYFQVDRCGQGLFTRKPSTHKTTSRANYLYRAPCGRSLLTLDEVDNYLLQTNSKLTIKFFIDDRSTRLGRSIAYHPRYILDEDLSKGKEHVKISVYNENNLDRPEAFIYCTETRSKLTVRTDSTSTTCCSCTDNCRDRLKCPCWLKTFEQAKLNKNEQILIWQRQHFSDEQMISRFAYVHQRLKTPVWSGIYECNSNCSCHTKQCSNRLVQNSLYQQVQLYHTTNKGWAIRALHDIPHGSFLNAYVGELITESMARKRDFKYLAILDHKSHVSTAGTKKRTQPMYGCSSHDGALDKSTPMPARRCVRLSTDSSTDDEVEASDSDDEESSFIIDAKHYGSTSRFYNHSCKPNVHIQNVFVNSHDVRFPVIALFACRHIRTGEEICWDYNYTVGCMPGVRIDCQCQASNCRGRLL